MGQSLTDVNHCPLTEMMPTNSTEENKKTAFMPTSTFKKDLSQIYESDDYCDRFEICGNIMQQGFSALTVPCFYAPYCNQHPASGEILAPLSTSDNRSSTIQPPRSTSCIKHKKINVFRVHSSYVKTYCGPPWCVF
jgi:hypothetical protein